MIMLNFENLDGFVIDLTTDELCNEILEDILCGDSVVYASVILHPLQRKREFIIDYFTDTYEYVFCKSAYVYQICESELYTNDEFESLRKRVEQGFQYAMEKDNEIEELSDWKYSNNVLVKMLDDEQERNNSLIKENITLKDTLTNVRNANTTMKEKLGKIYRVVKGDFEQ